MKRFAPIWVLAAFATASICDGSILHCKTLTIDFTSSEDAEAKASWSPSDHLSITRQGLGWDGNSTSSRDGWIQTKPLALGLSWRPPYAVSVRVTIYPPPAEILDHGQKTTPYGGDVFVRYSPDLKHWSTWQALQYAVPRRQAEKANPGRHYEGAVRVPRRQRKEYEKLLSEYAGLDVPWKSDEEAAVRWILDRHPDFLSRQLPFVGYVEFLFEQSFPGGQRIRSFSAEVRYCMGGLHSAPKDENAYKDRDTKAWRFKADEKAAPSNPKTGQAVGALETFLGALASRDFKKAYELVAPSSRTNGDPIAYKEPLDYKSFVRELAPHVSDDSQPPGGLRKFMEYKLGNSRWESPDRLRVLVTFQGWDRDEVRIVREGEAWYIADPIHIIR